MSMINCPECGKEVSDKAKACPNCGVNIAEVPSAPSNDSHVQPGAKKPPVEKKGRGCLWAVVGFLVFIIIIVAAGTKSASKMVNNLPKENSSKEETMDPLQECAELSDEEFAIVKSVLDECKVNYVSAEYDKDIDDLYDDGVWGYWLDTKESASTMLFLSKVDNSVIRLRYGADDLWADGGYKNNLADVLNRPSLEIVGDTKGVVEYSYIHITGIIRNNTAKSYSYVQVTFGIYDADGNKVGTALDNIAGLGANETWSFDALGMGTKNGTYKLEGIKGY